MHIEELINFSVPLFDHEGTVTWNQYANVSLSVLIRDILMTLTEGNAMSRMAVLLQMQNFVVCIPDRPRPNMEAIINTVLHPGDYILILSGREFAAQDPIIGDRSTPMAEIGMGFNLLMRAFAENGGGQTGAVQRIAARYQNLLVGQTDLEDDEEEGDEEYIDPRLLGPLAHPREPRAAEPSTVITGIKKVINEETFLRVCPLLTTEEIQVLRVPIHEEEPIGVEENDTIGGPQDAGLGACAVCLSLLVNRLKDAGQLRKTPCQHYFHSDCLNQWLTQNAITCPVCRHPAVTEAKDYGYLGYGTADNVFTPAISVSETPDSVIPDWMPILGRLPRASMARRID
jgi:hypothetical protein